MGYILGKVEGKGTNWHGHVTAVTVAPDFRYASPHLVYVGSTCSMHFHFLVLGTLGFVYAQQLLTIAFGWPHGVITNLMFVRKMCHVRGLL
jgi:hypothetical protein